MTSSFPTRPSWDDTWLAAARVIGTHRSLCVRATVGCVVVAADNRVVSTGYNGPAAGFDHRGLPCTSWCPRALMASQSVDHGLRLDYTDCPSMHAEANALVVGDARDRQAGTLYVTSHVCLGCAKLVANSGLARVVVATDTETPWREPARSYEYLTRTGLTVTVNGEEYPCR